tara:strand:- start:81 stop:995 length:915 start_codon:yes stop_codon:yes gene_type:complete
MTKQLTEEDMQTLALKEKYYDDMYTRGAVTGAGIDFAGSVIDYLSTLSGANLAQGLAESRLGRAKRLSAAAGSGAAERLAGAEARKTAVARDAAMKAATQAAQDPTGAAAVTIAQQMPDVIARAADTSKEETLEMDRALQQKAAAEQMRSEAEVGQLMAKQAKERARFGLVKGAFESAGELAATLKPKTYETKQAGIAERQQKKVERIGGRREKTMAKIGALQDKQADLDAAGKSLSESDQARLDKLLRKSQRQEKRQLKAFGKRAEAQSNLEAARQAELNKLRQAQSVLASPFTLSIAQNDEQ